jgi:hypothetical protein
MLCRKNDFLRRNEAAATSFKKKIKKVGINFKPLQHLQSKSCHHLKGNPRQQLPMYL